MATKVSRAIQITIATAIAGEAVKEGSVMLVPEDVTEDTARSLMKMSRPRAKKADEKQVKKRLADFNKEQEERKAKEAEERKAAEEAAKAEMDELAKLQQEVLEEAEAKAGEIVEAAKAEAKEIIAAATDKVSQNDAAVMRAKMRVTSVEKHGKDSETLHFTAVGKSEVYPDDGLDEDNTFATFTPSADLNLMVNNPALVGKFKQDDTFYLDFSKATKAKSKG